MKNNLNENKKEPFVCIYSKIKSKREYIQRASDSDEKEILYRAFSPRAQILVHKTKPLIFLSVSYLTYKNIKIKEITCLPNNSLQEFTFTIHVEGKRKPSKKVNRMNHVVYNINDLSEFVSNPSYKFKVKINNIKFLKEKGIKEKDNSLEILTTITDPYESYPPFIENISNLNIKEIKL